jgi:hypothetical protein
MQVLACDHDSVQYEYRLRLEEMAQWFPCFVAGLQITNMTMQGWSEKPLMYLGGSNTGCFWTPPGMTCAEFQVAATTTNGELQPVSESVIEAKAMRRDGHATGAAQRWQAFYTQEVADMVFDLYQRDFQAFGYERTLFNESRPR